MSHCFNDASDDVLGEIPVAFPKRMFWETCVCCCFKNDTFAQLRIPAVHEANIFIT